MGYFTKGNAKGNKRNTKVFEHSTKGDTKGEKEMLRFFEENQKVELKPRKHTYASISKVPTTKVTRQR